MFAMLISLPCWRRLCLAGLKEGGEDAGERWERAKKERGGAGTVRVNKVWWEQGVVRQGGNRKREVEKV